MAANKVRMEMYKRQMEALKETLTSINEDENLSEYIDETKTKALQDEIKVYEEYCGKADRSLRIIAETTNETNPHRYSTFYAFSPSNY